jgi:hypothetical protein
MDGESRGQPLRPVIAAWRRARFAAWVTAVGIGLSSVTVALSAGNAISTQQAIALALPAVLISVGGVGGWVVLDAWIAWRRGFHRGRNAALASQACLLQADDATSGRADGGGSGVNSVTR